MISSDERQRVAVTLLILRLTVFLVMFMWTLDKFIRPEHAIAVYQHFYFLPGFASAIIYAIGAAEIVLLLGFVIGFVPRLTYGLVLLLHAVSTFSSYRQYFTPFEKVNLLFFAAWPMLAGCFALYYLRDLDTLCSVAARKSSATSY